MVRRGRVGRMAGSLSGEASVVVDAPPERVWAMVADVTRMGEWSPETERAEWVDGADRAAVGARFKGHNRRGRSRWTTTCEVIAADAGRRFAFAVGDREKPSTIWRYTFEPVGTGTRVTESFEVPRGIGRFGRLVTRVTTGVEDREADLVEGVRRTLAALKERAEG